MAEFLYGRHRFPRLRDREVGLSVCLDVAYLGQPKAGERMTASQPR